jgi:hypothetical protein
MTAVPLSSFRMLHSSLYFTHYKDHLFGLNYIQNLKHFGGVYNEKEKNWVQ